MFINHAAAEIAETTNDNVTKYSVLVVSFRMLCDGKKSKVVKKKACLSSTFHFLKIVLVNR